MFVWNGAKLEFSFLNCQLNYQTQTLNAFVVMTVYCVIKSGTDTLNSLLVLSSQQSLRAVRSIKSQCCHQVAGDTHHVSMPPREQRTAGIIWRSEPSESSGDAESRAGSP